MLENEDYVCKLNKALYGLNQAPISWYSRFDKYLQQGFKREAIDNNIYIKTDNENMLIIFV